jgi:hypothetical protein
MDNFIPSENPSGVEQLKRSVVIAAQNVARLHSQLENEPDEFTRSSCSNCCCLRRKSLV